MPSLSFTPRLLTAALALVVIFGATGCDHVTDPDGPRLIDTFGPFAIGDPVGADRATVDFAAGQQVVFSGTFSKQVDWVLEITGLESGAVRRIEGFSDELNATNAVWQGRTTNLPFFKQEDVEAALFVPSENSDTTRVTIAVDAPRTYPGNVFSDFEGGEDIFIGNFEFEFENAGISNEVPAGEGETFYLMRGTDDVVRNFFAGLIDVRPDNGGIFDVPTTVPEDLYFNFMIRSFETDFTIAVVQLVVDDNGTGAYELDQDAIFPFGDIEVDFEEGWRLFSKPVSELGLSEEEAQNIVGVRVVLISDANSQPTPALQVAFGIDYITFTAGSPLEL
ncbi:MAG: hypothetical protein AAGI52_18635 [Bacteroidota bacterium]